MKFTLLLLFFAGLAGFQSFAQAEEYIVRFANSADKDTAKNTLESNGFEMVQVIPQLNMYVAQPFAKRAPDMDGLMKSAAVLYVEPNYRRRAIAVPNDKNYDIQPGLRAMGAEKAWDISTGSKNVIVAVIDTGIFLSHTDLKNQLWVNPGEIAGNGKDDDSNGFVDDVNGWDFINKDNNPTDDQSHGSHCAGIIGAETNNANGIAGMTWDVRLMAIKFLSAGGSGDDADGILGIVYATDNGAHIISASWGSTDFSQALLDAVNYASEKGVLFVAAAGNSKENADVKAHYPSGYDTRNMISVGAASSTKGKADFSNYGRTRTHLAAPGVNIYSTVNAKNSYGKKSGTSMATPMVAGEAALILAAHPNLAMTDLRNAILNGVETVSAWNNRAATNGFARADLALEQFAGGPQIWPKYIRLAEGSSHQMTAFNLSGEWSATNTVVATISAAGEVSAVAKGTTEIMVTDSAGGMHKAYVEVVEGKKSSGGCAGKGQGVVAPDISEASMGWYVLLFVLPMFINAYLRRRRFRS